VGCQTWQHDGKTEKKVSIVGASIDDIGAVIGSDISDRENGGMSGVFWD